MRFLLVSAALITSVLAFIGTASTGLFMAGVNESGVQGTGVLLLLGAVVAFLSALWTVFAPARQFRGKGRALAVLATLLATIPLLAISAAAFSFSGNPLGSPSPALDWAAFGAALLLALGVFSLVALAVSKSRRPLGSGHQTTGPVRPVDNGDEEVRVIPAA